MADRRPEKEDSSTRRQNAASPPELRVGDEYPDEAVHDKFAKVPASPVDEELRDRFEPRAPEASIHDHESTMIVRRHTTVTTESPAAEAARTPRYRTPPPTKDQHLENAVQPENQEDQPVHAPATRSRSARVKVAAPATARMPEFAVDDVEHTRDPAENAPTAAKDQGSARSQIDSDCAEPLQDVLIGSTPRSRSHHIPAAKHEAPRAYKHDLRYTRISIFERTRQRTTSKAPIRPARSGESKP
ncbi:hypothetical protein FQA39_LY19246 [Lamprigera yunnana]|nr:hypothetical protein FQA39_LY19246 [Lamprigera yunnana]